MIFEVLRGSPRQEFAPVGRCIYCGTDARSLSDEHIIPHALGGNLILPKASCSACAEETKKIEQVCARRMFGPYRIRARMPTRRPRERPQHLSLDIVDTKGDADSIKVSASDHPSILAMFVWGPPRLFMTNPAVDAKAGVWLYFPDATTQRTLLRPDVKGLRIGFSGIRSFARMLAKIAYCFAIERKYLRIDPNSDVVRCIMNDGYDYLPFVGGWISDQTKLSGVLHHVRFIKITDRGTMYLVAEIRLFADLGTPLYEVVLASRPAL